MLRWFLDLRKQVSTVNWPSPQPKLVEALRNLFEGEGLLPARSAQLHAPRIGLQTSLRDTKSSCCGTES